MNFHFSKISSAGFILLLSTLLLFSCEDEPPETDPDYAVVETLTVRETLFKEWIATTGTIEALNDAVLRAEIPGTVVQIKLEGEQVNQGDIVMQTDPGQAEAGVTQARAAVEEAETTLTQIEDEIERIEPLARDTIVSPLELSQLQSQRNQLSANVQQALAVLQEAEDALDQTRLTAPFDGIVEQRWVRIGEQITTGQEVVRIVGDGLLEAVAGLPERFSGDIQAGDEAVIGLDAYGIREIYETVSVVGSAIDPMNRTFQVRVALDDPENAIKSDMIASMRILRHTLEEALVVPPGAVQRDEAGESLLVAIPEDTLAVVDRRNVLTGPRSEDGIVIEDGLQAGEEIIITGLTEAVSGDTVRIVRRFEDIDDYRTTLEEEIEAAQINP